MNKQQNDRMNERASERTKERKKEKINERTNERKPNVFCTLCLYTISLYIYGYATIYTYMHVCAVLYNVHV